VTWISRLRGNGAGDRGSTNIEMAILFPVFVLMILVGVQVAIIFQGRNAALAAAQQGAAAQAAYQAPAGAGEERAATYMTRMGDLLTDWDVTVTSVAEGGDQPTAVRVTVSGTALGWFGTHFRVSQTAYSPIQRFTSEGDE
jgi:Flp pilus assembly protein TadG